MKGLVSVLSSVFVGLMLAATNFAPILGLHRFLENRRRVFNAILLGAAGFIFLMASVLIFSIDLVVQYEDQGLFFWNAILTLASTLGLAAVACFVGANVCMPSAKEYMVFSGESPLDKLQSYLKQGFAAASTGASQAAQPEPKRPDPVPNHPSSPLYTPKSTVPPERPAYAH